MPSPPIVVALSDDARLTSDVCLTMSGLGPMYATDVRQTSDVRQQHRLMPRLGGGGIITCRPNNKSIIIIIIGSGEMRKS